jgi:DNA-damage-inducible protein J
MAAGTIVRARIDANTKERATAALEAMGLSVSDAIRLLMLRIADEQRLPFAIEVPNAGTRRAMKELEDRKGKTHGSTTDMRQCLNRARDQGPRSYAPSRRRPRNR